MMNLESQVATPRVTLSRVEKPRPTLRKSIKHKENPFIGKVCTTIKTKKKYGASLKNNEAIFNTETAEISDKHVESKIVTLVDDAKFVKIFQDGIAGIYELTNAGKRVFRLLLEIVQENQGRDTIYMHHTDTERSEIHKMSKVTYFRGLGELVDKEFLASSDRTGMYFLNPLMLWNGDRFRFIKEYVRIRPTAKPEKTPSIEKE